MKERIGDGPPPLPPRPVLPETKPASPRGYVSLRVASLWPCVPSCRVRTETETKRNGTGTTCHWQNGNGNQRTERKPSGRNRTNGQRPDEPRTGRETEKEGKCAAILLPSFLPLFPFSVLFPFLFARKKNYFSAFTLCLATFRKKSKNKFVK